ncbi:MAG: 2,3-bisphosphoglycerate-dependent phosphoglycerate mutase, partial [Betaproteobacteria bacterium]|nr:2,3-bisphosphoglycerate-dependent phosphoglycerate mutase [Betaproteobacteria bacterium]
AYAVAPKPLPAGDPRESDCDPRYADVPPGQIPRTECLQDTVARVVPFWEQRIAPAVLSGRQLLISAHGNSIRALLKHLAQISDQEIVELNIPTAQPLWVEFDQDLNYQAHRYLGKVEMTDREIDRATASVAAQGNSDTARIECR